MQAILRYAIFPPLMKTLLGIIDLHSKTRDESFSLGDNGLLFTDKINTYANAAKW